MKKAFTIIELMIVVAILGILAAITLPSIQGHITNAKESAAKDNLRTLRQAVERYANDHDGVPPGYYEDDLSVAPTGLSTKIQLENGYLSEIPENPFNGLNTIFAINDFQESPDDSTGWLYKPSTKEIRLNSEGKDNKGISYFSY